MHELEASQYFYHSDHLGSSSFISDVSGYAVQHLQYMPFGEPNRPKAVSSRTLIKIIYYCEQTMVDLRMLSTFNSRYTFSGKEKDDETQYSYFGARYYDSDLSVWLCVDPMADKYPSMSPFMYCAGNPVMLVDPDGRDIWIEGEDGTRVQYKQGMQYDGTDKKIIAKITSLNQMNETKNGKTILTALTSSTNIYDIKDGDGSNPNFKANNKETGKSGGTINTLGKDGLLDLSHELFHAYQDEQGQGGASIFNEVEAYLFSSGVDFEYSMANNLNSSSSFGLARTDTDDGKSYEKSAYNLTHGLVFAESEFLNVVNLFKTQSIKNADGDYDKSHYQLRRSNQKDYLLKNLFPLYK